MEELTKASLIHIGYHKTGTTFFQKNFYPMVRNADYIDRRIIQKDLLAKRPFYFSADKFVEKIKTISTNRFIICDEDISGNIFSGGLYGCFSKEMGMRLHTSFPHAHIIIFIRNQVSMIASIYAFYVKGGGTERINHFLFSGESNYVSPSFSFAHFDYKSLVGFYQNLFGKDNVHVFCYEDFAQDNYLFLKKYAAHFNLDIAIEKVELSIVNTGINDSALRLRRWTNLFYKKGPSPKRYIIHIPWFIDKINGLIARYSSLTGKRRIHNEAILGVSNIKYIHEFFSKSNRALASMVDLPLSQYSYPGFTNKY